MALEVVLVRHAIAFERNRTRWPNDRLRPLTVDGKRRFRKAAAGLTEWAPRVESVLCSPLLRARETSELLIRIADWPEPEVCEELAPGVSPARIFARLRKQSARRIALVGHEPGLSTLLSIAIGGEDAKLSLELKKGGVACIRFPDRIEPRRAALLWLVPPRLLRRLR